MHKIYSEASDKNAPIPSPIVMIKRLLLKANAPITPSKLKEASRTSR
jgi:hypothetical protein